MPISNNVRTNIPVIRKPFGAELPPRVPYIMEENVGSASGDAQAVCVEGRRIVPVTASMGGAKKAIYLENGIFREGDNFTSVSVTPSSFQGGMEICRISIDGVEYIIKSPVGIESVSTKTLKTPLLTPMWFDHRPNDDMTWIPTLYKGDGAWAIYAKNSAGKWTVSNAQTTDAIDDNIGAGYTRVYEHLLSDYSSVTTEKSATYNGVKVTSGGQTTTENITIKYHESADGHKICLSDQEANLVKLYQDESIGTAWYFMIKTDTPYFRLPRTRYSFHGNLSHVKMPYEEPNSNITMMLYFHADLGESGSFEDIFDMLYPVGTIYTSVLSELPSIFFGNGRQWTKVATGRCLWGCESNQELGALGKSILPNHVHHIPTSESDAIGNTGRLSTAKHGSYVGSGGYNNCNHVAYTNVVAAKSTGEIISAWPSISTSNSEVKTGSIVRPPVYTVTFFKRIA